MKILELCRSDGHGGLELYAERVIRELHRRGIPVTAVTAPDTMLAGRLERAEVRQDSIPLGSVALPFRAAYRLAQIIDRDEIDVVHIHMRTDIDAAVWARKLARRRVGLVHTRQMQITRTKRDPYHRLIYGSIDRWIAVTDALAAQIRDLGGVRPERVTRLYYGVAKPVPATGEARDEFVRENQIPQSGLRIGVFARIHPVKCQHLVVEAIGILRNRGVDASAVLVGYVMDPPYLDALFTRAAELVIGDRVTHAGFVDNAPRFMNLFDVVVLPTHGETFGLALAEAMRAGVAVIGANAAGVPELIRDSETGLLFEANDAQGLAAALERLARDPQLRARLASQGQAFADIAFDETRHFDELFRIFEQTIGTHA